MADKTGIQWTHAPGFEGATWNPLRGCTRVSPGCENCYAEKRAHRIVQQQRGLIAAGKLKGPPAYGGTVRLSKKGEPRWTSKIQLAPHLLDQPLRWKKPRLIFANSMSDLFHENVPYEYITACFGVMAAAPRHIFQVLTKRPDRAELFFEWLTAKAEQANRQPYSHGLDWCRAEVLHDCAYKAGVRHRALATIDLARWPLPNVWLGVSIESDEYRKPRLDALRRVPNAVPWVSQEPQIGDVTYTDEELSWLQWVVIGGESGAKAKVRPFHLDWARKTERQCREAGVAFFNKQLGTVPYQDDDFPADTAYTGTKIIDGVEKPGLCFPDKKGGTMEQWPADLRVRDYPPQARRASI